MTSEGKHSSQGSAQEARIVSGVERDPPDLVALFDATPDNPEEDAEGLRAARAEIRKTFEHLQEIIPEFTLSFRQVLEKAGVDPGKISVYLIGGRVVGKPLSANSDIDIIFAFERPVRVGSKEAPINWLTIRKELLHDQFVAICSRYDIPNHSGYPGRFQIMAWGDRTPAEVQGGLAPGEKAVLVFEG